MNFTYLQAASFFPTVRRSSPWRSSKPTNRHAIVRAVSTSSHGCCEMSGTVWAQANTQKTTQGNSNSSRVAVNCCFRFVSWIIKKRQVMSQESITPKKISVYRKSSGYIFINIYYIYIYLICYIYVCYWHVIDNAFEKPKTSFVDPTHAAAPWGIKFDGCILFWFRKHPRKSLGQ